jgi:8-oxo-dGTP diphosphatase
MPGGRRGLTKAEVLSNLKASLHPISEAPRFLGPDHAAVVLLMTLRDGSLEVLFGRRTENARDPWSGQIAFPGGRSKEIDATLMQTACREFFEETFVDICKRSEVLGYLDTVSPRNVPNITVTPFVAFSERKFLFTPSAEVAEVFWAPLDRLEKKEVDVEVRGAVLRRVTAFVYGQKVIWGLTANIMNSFIEAVGTDKSDAV